MSFMMLNALLTRALLDPQFSKDILNGKRAQRVSEFDLSQAEKQAILAIQADNLDQFIHQISDWMYASQDTSV